MSVPPRDHKNFHIPKVDVTGPYKDRIVQGYRGGRYLGAVHRVDVTCPKTQRAPWVWPEHQSTYMNRVHVCYADEFGEMLENSEGVPSDDFVVIDVLIEGLALRTGNYGDDGELGFYFDYMGIPQHAYAELAEDEHGQLWLIITPHDADPGD